MKSVPQHHAPVCLTKKYCVLFRRSSDAHRPFTRQRYTPNRSRDSHDRCQWRAAASAAAEVAEGVQHHAAGRVDVVLTREQGKNASMAQRLSDKGLRVLELPLVETGAGPDRDRLPQMLADGKFDYVIVTSPESANVFIAGWLAAGQPQVRVAVVGEGTGRVLRAHESGMLEPAFVPSVANAVHLSAELPLHGDGPHRVLYPASAKAGSDLQNGLAARGVEVIRLNTYTTQAVSSIGKQQLQPAREARVLAVASPSAIKAWAQLAGVGQSPAIACIGTTSSKAATKLGFPHVYTTANPGLDGFVEAITEALSAS